jgi:glucosylceramidase
VKRKLSTIVIVLLVAFSNCNSSCNKGGGNGGGGGNPNPPNPPAPPTDINYWVTKSDQTALLFKQTAPLVFGTNSNSNPTIEVDSTVTYQTVDGFGYTLTGGSADLIHALGTTQRQQLLQELFSSDENAIGVSYLRISIGASDLSSSVFSYNDLPTGQTDPNLLQFSIAREEQTLIPVLQQILAINPNIKTLVAAHMDEG